jgi:diadenosine tetraphosphatase ApaH/serine/threonine PP2A family protein phosphatase
VGQPRDREPEACYVIYSREHRAFRFRRVAYDVAGAQQAIVAAGLPAYYAQRLELGR